MAIHQYEPLVLEVEGRDERKLILRTADGSTLELTYNEGPAGQVELSVWAGEGRQAVWAASELVLGGEGDDGYEDLD